MPINTEVDYNNVVIKGTVEIGVKGERGLQGFKGDQGPPVPVAHELGDDPDLAVSQKLLTDAIADMEQSNEAAVMEATQEGNRAEQEADRSKREADRAEKAADDLSGPYEFVGDYAPAITLTKYRQVVRDSHGEFWRVSGQVDLPYTTTGDGLPENSAFVPVGDAVLRQDLANPSGGVNMVAGAFRKGLIQGTPAPAYDVRTILHSDEATDRRVIGIIDGLLYANSSTALYSSADMGETWTFVRAMTGRWQKMLKCADGEILYTTGGREVFKSSGWGQSPATATFSSVVDVGPVANVLRWSIDGDGTKFIVTHYSSSDRAASRYAFISTDTGDTWQQVWDSVDKFGQAAADGTHIHATCYDPFNDRFWLCEGHLDLGVWYSDDNGSSWNRLETDGLYKGSSPTTLTATPYGIVAGTDEFPDGVHIIKGSAPETLKVEVVYIYRATTNSTTLQCDVSVTDPETGMVYIAARGFSTPANSVILASNGESAGIVFESESSSPIYNLAVSQGKFFAEQEGTPYRTIKGRVSVIGSREPLYDKGNHQPTEIAPNLSIALGRGARAPGLRATAIGRGAQAGTVGGDRALVMGDNALVETGQLNVAIGSEVSIKGATGTYGTLVGSLSSITGASHVTALGYNIRVTNNSATAVGSLAAPVGSNSSVFGYLSTTTGGNSVAVGARATAGLNACAVGTSATATGTGSVAAGNDAVSGNSSVSIGATASSGTLAVAVGPGSTSTGNGVAIGAQATNTGSDRGVAIGRSASNTAAAGIALGSQAECTHPGSVALGAESVTQRDLSVCVGNRDIESVRAGGRVILRSPDGNTWSITVSNSGELTVEDFV